MVSGLGRALGNPRAGSVRVESAFLSYPMGAPCCGRMLRNTRSALSAATHRQGYAPSSTSPAPLLQHLSPPPTKPPSQPGQLLLAPLLLAARVVEALHIDMAAPPLTTEEADSPQMFFNDEGWSLVLPLPLALPLALTSLLARTLTLTRRPSACHSRVTRKSRSVPASWPYRVPTLAP